MRKPRPFLASVVAAVPCARLGDLELWAREMTEAGVDGLALEGDPGDPSVRGLLGSLRRASALPLEVHVPEGIGPDGLWAEVLAEVGVDWLVPAHPLSRELMEEITARGTAVAWPAEWDPPEWRVPRIHARTEAGYERVFGRFPDGHERSLKLPLRKDPEPAGSYAVDRLILPGEALAGQDPRARLEELRE